MRALEELNRDLAAMGLPEVEIDDRLPAGAMALGTKGWTLYAHRQTEGNPYGPWMVLFQSAFPTDFRKVRGPVIPGLRSFDQWEPMHSSLSFETERIEIAHARYIATDPDGGIHVARVDEDGRAWINPHPTPKAL